MIIVTGGAGFIGSNIVAALNQAGRFDVVVADTLGEADKWRNIAKRDLAAVVPPAEITTYLERNGDAVEAIIHMGAISATTASDVDALVATNITFTQALWDWCIRHNKRFIYASSASTYGDGSAGFDDEETTQALAALKPLNPYGWSKHVMDKVFVRAASSGAPIPPQWVGLKFFNVYGPNEYHKGSMRSVVHQLHVVIAAGKPARLFKSHQAGIADGQQKRDFIYVRDCADVVLWLLDNPSVSGLFNLGTGAARSFEDLANAVFAAAGKTPHIEYIDTPERLRQHYQYFTEARMERLRAAGYRKPFATVEEGVRDYVESYLSRDDMYL